MYNIIMKLYVSYFYNVRFLKPWQIPVSTACWDPKWFHDFKGQDFKFIDKRNVLNGLRAEFLHPDSSCNSLCHGKDCCNDLPESCKFLQAYRKQIFSLDKDEALNKFRKLEAKIKDRLHIREELEIVLMVHEAPSNICSEREVLKEFFSCEELCI